MTGKQSKKIWHCFSNVMIFLVPGAGICTIVTSLRTYEPSDFLSLSQALLSHGSSTGLSATFCTCLSESQGNKNIPPPCSQGNMLKLLLTLLTEHWVGGKRDEGSFFPLSSWILEIINTRKPHSLQNYSCQIITIPLPQIRQLFPSLGKCSPAISVHFHLNTGLRGLNKLKQFTVIAKI